MKDMILAMIGSLVACGAAYWHHRWPESSPLRDELSKFYARNKHLVPRRTNPKVNKHLGDIEGR